MQGQNNKKYTTFGERILFVRKQNALSQADLSEKLGFTKPAVVSRFERNERLPNAETLIKLAELLNIDLHWLLTGNQSPDAVNLKEQVRPFVLAHLAEVTKDIYDLEKRRQSLVASQQAGQDHSQELREIESHVTKRHLYYKSAFESLDKTVGISSEDISQDRLGLPDSWNLPDKKQS